MAAAERAPHDPCAQGSVGSVGMVRRNAFRAPENRGRFAAKMNCGARKLMV
jgi:hypothetical protein